MDEPKFKVGDEVFVINKYKPISTRWLSFDLVTIGAVIDLPQETSINYIILSTYGAPIRDNNMNIKFVPESDLKSKEEAKSYAKERFLREFKEIFGKEK